MNSSVVLHLISCASDMSSYHPKDLVERVIIIVVSIRVRVWAKSKNGRGKVKSSHNHTDASSDPTSYTLSHFWMKAIPHAFLLVSCPLH